MYQLWRQNDVIRQGGVGGGDLTLLAQELVML
jgi:hypothetical protein